MKLSIAILLMIIVLPTFPLFVKTACADHPGKIKSFQQTGILSSLNKADAWLNETVHTEDLKGKVVLVEFGTYTCINWLRTLPYVRAWAEKYKSKGLVVIVVHTPEFSFEKSINNVRTAVKTIGLNIPVAIDNGQKIWNAFSNQYWPALYLLDSKGHIRHHQFGERGYDQSEQIIQELLVEAGAKDVDIDPVLVNARGIEVAADWNSLKSPENYLGYERTTGFSSPDLSRDKQKSYAAPRNVRLNQWALTGEWTVQQQSVMLNKANGKIVNRFHARDLHLVMGPAIEGIPVRFRVLINGKAPGDSHGADIDEQGNGTITDPRLYQLIRQRTTITDCEIEIEFLDHGAEAFAFTFG